MILMIYLIGSFVTCFIKWKTLEGERVNMDYSDLWVEKWWFWHMSIHTAFWPISLPLGFIWGALDKLWDKHLK
jgi:hypothetical protein